MGMQVLIVHTDTTMRTTIRQTLETRDYTLLEADDVETGLAMLSATEGLIVTLFSVALFNNIMTGTDGVAFLGAASHDAQRGAQRGAQHAFVILTPTPDQVYAVLGRLLSHLAIPVVAQPIIAEDLVGAIDRAARDQLSAVHS
jgi:CheY-like chemotaxis protein